MHTGWINLFLISAVILNLPGCGGGTRGTGTRPPQTLNDQKIKDTLAWPKFDGEALTPPSCRLGSKMISIRSDLGFATLSPDDELKCNFLISPQALSADLLIEPIRIGELYNLHFELFDCSMRILSYGKLNGPGAANSDIALPMFPLHERSWIEFELSKSAELGKTEYIGKFRLSHQNFNNCK